MRRRHCDSPFLRHAPKRPKLTVTCTVASDELKDLTGKYIEISSQPSTPIGSSRVNFGKMKNDVKMAIFLSPNLKAGYPVSNMTVEELQRMWTALRHSSDSRDRVEEIVHELIGRFSLTESLKTATGEIVLSVTEKRLKQILPETDFGFIWALTRGITHCAGCDSPLDIDTNYSSVYPSVSWHAPVCGHALRYCDSCKYNPCWMCGCTEDKVHRSIIQSDTTVAQEHAHCINEPCDVCKP